MSRDTSDASDARGASDANDANDVRDTSNSLNSISLGEGLNYSIHTFGCKVNTYDSGLLQSRLSRVEFVHKPTTGGSTQHTAASAVASSVSAASAVSIASASRQAIHIHILNTCAVTAEATKESLRWIRKIKAKDPHSIILVTGCSAQVDTDFFINEPLVDLIVANSHKGQLEKILQSYLQGELKERVFKSNIFKKKDLEEGGGQEREHTRSFLKIQDGCNSFCTFCVIPFARGKSRSVNVGALVRKVKELYAQGVRETVLTGVHIGDYRDDQGRHLENLVEELLDQTSMPRFRLSSLEPIELSEKLLALYTNPRICPHFHISLQSAQTDVLQSMGRKYGHEEVGWALNEIAKRVPHGFVGMDMIVGFPGETEEQFYETYTRMESLPWTRIHVFPYSPRPGVYANRIGGALHRHEILERAKKLRELSRLRYTKKALEQVGKRKQVMVFKGGNQGLSEDYWRLTWEKNKQCSPGQVVPMKVIGYDHSQPSKMDGVLVGESERGWD